MNVTERFLKYVSFETASNEDSPSCPSTDCQLDLGKALLAELTALGAESRMDSNGYVYAFIPGKGEKADLPCLGLIAHMDTSPAVTGKNPNPRIIHYQGGDIELGTDENGRKIVTALKTFPMLNNYKGKHLIVTDGRTLLGADDKAGVAEIMTVCDDLINGKNKDNHRPLAIGFTPDEEIGRGADLFDLKNFPAVTAYTIDGGELGEIEYENFNAAAVLLKVHGVNVHPGSAKNVMKNAILMAQEWMNLFPANEVPSHTEKYEGFYHLCTIEGDETLVTIKMIVRDHDRLLFEKRKAFVENACAYMNSVWGDGSFELRMTDSYYNMKEKIQPHMELITNAEKAFADCGATTKVMPIRGGTDGARLSYEGLPCPNLSVGGFGFHGVHEIACVEDMETMVQVLLKLCM